MTAHIAFKNFCTQINCGFDLLCSPMFKYWKSMNMCLSNQSPSPHLPWVGKLILNLISTNGIKDLHAYDAGIHYLFSCVDFM